MYALKLSNEIYHLLQRGGHNTLCGLRISRLKGQDSQLQPADELLPHEKICKHCRRIQTNDDIE